MDVEARHEALANLGTDAVEGAKGAVHECAFEEVDAENEDLEMLEAVLIDMSALHTILATGKVNGERD